MRNSEIPYCTWHRTITSTYSVVVITTAQLNSTKPEFRFCAGSNPTRGASEICNGENRLEIWAVLVKSYVNAIRRIHLS